MSQSQLGAFSTSVYTPKELYDEKRDKSVYLFYSTDTSGRTSVWAFLSNIGLKL